MTEEDGGDIFAVKVDVGGLRGASDSEEGGHEIKGGEDGLFVLGASFGLVNNTRAPGNKRRASAAFVKGGLGSSEWTSIASSGFRTIVRTDDDEGVVSQFASVADVVKDLA